MKREEDREVGRERECRMKSERGKMEERQGVRERYRKEEIGKEGGRGGREEDK